MDKATLINHIKNYASCGGRNSMGCSEDWYIFAYAMKETFTIEEIAAMSEHEIQLLAKLHNSVADGLY